MKTRSVKSNNFLKSILLILVLFIGVTQKGMSQDEQGKEEEKEKKEEMMKEIEKSPIITPRHTHAIRLTPFKAMIVQRLNLGYEMKLHKDLYATSEFQAWFVNKVPFSFLAETEDKIKNKGLRCSLGVRGYLYSQKKSVSFYLGTSVFYGHHLIQAEQSPTFGNFEGRHGKINISSQGIKFSLGFKKVFNNKIFIELGVDIGKAWTNKKEDRITLYPKLRSDGIYTKRIGRITSDIFMEPMIAFGYNF